MKFKGIMNDYYVYVILDRFFFNDIEGNLQFFFYFKMFNKVNIKEVKEIKLNLKFSLNKLWE